jgi:hypothetical protein
LHTASWYKYTVEERFRITNSEQVITEKVIRIPSRLVPVPEGIRQLYQWICHGKIEKQYRNVAFVASLAELGEDLEIPPLQDYCLEVARDCFAEGFANGFLPTREDVAQIYRMSHDFSMIRWLTAAVVSCCILRNISRRELPREYRDWEAFLDNEEMKNLKDDLVWAGARDWMGKMPWHKDHKWQFLYAKPPPARLAAIPPDADQLVENMLGILRRHRDSEVPVQHGMLSQPLPQNLEHSQRAQGFQPSRRINDKNSTPGPVNRAFGGQVDDSMLLGVEDDEDATPRPAKRRRDQGDYGYQPAAAAYINESKIKEEVENLAKVEMKQEIKQEDDVEEKRD